MQPVVRYTLAALAIAAAAFGQAPAKPDAPATPFMEHNRAGAKLDIEGHYAEARQEFAKAMETAASPEEKARAARATAVSWAFEGNCLEAAKYDGPVYQGALAAKAFFDAGQVADELARICIDAGNLDEALAWYQKGRDAGLREPDIKPDRKDLWDFRWEHAQARVAARRGNAEEAHRHVAAAKAILDKGTNAAQAPFFPYLTGYVAFYLGDYKSALAELQKANQKDVFILFLLAQTYEKMGDRAKAMDYYRKVLENDQHSPANAAARPLAKKRVG